MPNLYTILINFSDHVMGVGQLKATSAESALKEFIRTTESLDGYDRDLLVHSLMPLIHIAKNNGLWSFYFDPDLMDKEWPNDNPVLGGSIIQTDPNGLVRVC